MTRFLMNLDEAVDLVHVRLRARQPRRPVHPEGSGAPPLATWPRLCRRLFGDTGTHIIGTRHGEKLYETLMTKEERMRSEDMGDYYRVCCR